MSAGLFFNTKHSSDTEKNYIGGMYKNWAVI